MIVATSGLGLETACSDRHNCEAKHLSAHAAEHASGRQNCKCCAGSRPDEQLLRLFEPASAVRRDVLQAVARELQFDEPEMSAELFALAGRHCYALEHLNFRLSREILGLSKAAGDARRQRAVDAVRALSLRAHELKQGCALAAHTCTLRANPRAA